MVTEYKDLLTMEAIELIKNDSPLILDVRTKKEYEQGHIKNSKLIPIDELQNRINEIENYKDKKILVYCRSGRRSKIALELLKNKGFRYIYNLKYGIIDWNEKGLEIEK
ncbi:MAG TPA: rhodanese-like domain-containing protein [bacterium]|nr:rhodanese-like domain-containing protein [bacterium]HPQ18423.1 rhodanese-like domain-containing protein [bacterium]